MAADQNRGNRPKHFGARGRLFGGVGPDDETDCRRLKTADPQTGA
jgi:hypothetical protein